MARRQQRNLLVLESSYRLSTTGSGGFTLSVIIAERQAQKLYKTIRIAFGLTRPRIGPESTVSVADALSTRPLTDSSSQMLIVS